MKRRLFSVENPGRSARLAERAVRADGFVSRAVGLLGRKDLPVGEGLWIEPCAQIHTFFMSFSIDAVFLDRGLKVVRVLENLPPWRVSPWITGARSVLELPARAAAGKVAVGDVLEMHER